MSSGTMPLQTALNTITQQIGYSIVAELQPIIDAIVASRRAERLFAERDVSVTLRATGGQTFVSGRRDDVRAETPPKISVRGLDARQLWLVFATMHEKIAEPLSVSTLSSVAGLSRSYFSHAFRMSVGRTPHAHIVRLRIEHAMKLMAGTGVPLSEIALAAGFSDQAHFSRSFRRMAGVTPTQWRRLHTVAPPIMRGGSTRERNLQHRDPRGVQNAAVTLHQ